MAQTTTKTQQRTSVVETPPAPVDNLPAARPRTTVNAIVPATWQEVTAIASAICRARMAPKSYCDRDGNPFPDKVAIAIMHGMEVGMTPMASLQSLAVINGMPGLYGDGLVGVVRASGYLEDLQEGLQTDENGKPLIAWCKVKRKGEPSWKERELTYVECIRAGWTNKDGPWKLTPGRMMTVRVRGWLLRDMFADVLRGLHSAEEIEDMVDITPQAAATTGPAPAEPKRADYAAQAGPQQDTGRAGMAANETTPQTPPRDQGGVDGQAGGDTAPAAGGRPAIDSGAPGQPAVTDVVDENDTPPEHAKPGQKLQFARFAKVSEFCDFADPFLEKTNDEGKRQFAEFYEGMLVAMERGKPAAQAAAKDYRAILNQPPREPGQEG